MEDREIPGDEMPASRKEMLFCTRSTNTARKFCSTDFIDLRLRDFLRVRVRGARWDGVTEGVNVMETGVLGG